MKFIKEFTKVYFSVDGYCTVVGLGGVLGGMVGTGYAIYDYKHVPTKDTFYNTVELSGHMLSRGLGGIFAGAFVASTLPLTIPALVITAVRSSIVNKTTN